MRCIHDSGRQLPRDSLRVSPTQTTWASRSLGPAVSVEERLQHGQEEVGLPGYLHVGCVRKDRELGSGDQLPHECAVFDGGEVSVAEDDEGGRSDAGELLI